VLGNEVTVCTTWKPPTKPSCTCTALLSTNEPSPITTDSAPTLSTCTVRGAAITGERASHCTYSA